MAHEIRKKFNNKNKKLTETIGEGKEQILTNIYFKFLTIFLEQLLPQKFLFLAFYFTLA